MERNQGSLSLKLMEVLLKQLMGEIPTQAYAMGPEIMRKMKSMKRIEE